MNEEKSIKSVLTVVLLLIIVGMAFAIYDLTRNDGAVAGSISDLVTTDKDSDDADKKEVSPPVKEVYTPPQATKPTPTPTPPPAAFEPGMVMVTYTDLGFIPPVVQVTAGGSINFINSSSKPLWVTSVSSPTAEFEVYRGLDQGKSISTGGSYVFSFTQIGVWGYTNLNQESHLGAVFVVEQ